MAWYRTGTVALTNGSPVVTGTGTGFVANVQSGHAINLPDGRAYEVLSVQSDTQLTLGNPNGYLGATVNGQAYSVQPNQGFAQTAATQLANFIAQFGAYLTTVLAGLFGDGSAARPGIAFAADQDTGIRRVGDNALALVSGGVDRLTANADGTIAVPQGFSGNVGFGTTAPTSRGHFASGAATQVTIESTSGGGDCATVYKVPGKQWNVGINIGGTGAGGFNFYDVGRGVAAATIDSGGNLLVGATSGSEHTVSKAVGQGSLICRVISSAGGAQTSVVFASVSGYSPNGGGAAAYFGHSTATSRSINASGTINANGADYAEYMTKSDGCGPIAKGDVCGVDRDGKLTRTWADAVTFAIKSTDPNLVGGDAWSQHLGPRPDAPGAEPIAPTPPLEPSLGSLAAPIRDPEEEAEAFAARLANHLVALRDAEAANAAYQAALVDYQTRTAAYPAELAAYTTALEAYERDLPIWEAALEAARATVDRIAYCGQVPVNFDGDCQPGDYLIAIANGGGIGVAAVAPGEITFDQYRNRVGRVLAIRDSRPWVQVQQG